MFRHATIFALQGRRAMLLVQMPSASGVDNETHAKGKFSSYNHNPTCSI